MEDVQREEKFRRTFTGWVVSSLGYRVKPLPRSCVLYKDQWGLVEVDAEMLVHEPYGYVIYTHSIPTGHHHSRAEIADRIRRAFRAGGGILAIDSSG